ncbi:MAG: hypothetical protein ACRC37_07060, partial [Lentisphaeria bacterium]
MATVKTRYNIPTVDGTGYDQASFETLADSVVESNDRRFVTNTEKGLITSMNTNKADKSEVSPLKDKIDNYDKAFSVDNNGDVVFNRDVHIG